MAVASLGSATGESALFRLVPSLRGVVPWQRLGAWPTPVEEHRFSTEGEAIYLKREDLSSPLYGGNKVRTLEGHLGAALASGAREVWSCGAFGSNHATAGTLHGRAVGLEPGVALFRQPPSRAAQDNMRAFMSASPLTRDIANVMLLPATLARLRKRANAYVMAPGGASPIGCLGHVGAALELAEQIRAGVCPAPRTIVVAVGSTCTSAGILTGLHLARRIGLVFGPGQAPMPRLLAVRATPWPVTSPVRIVGLANRTAALLERLAGSRFALDRSFLRHTLEVDGHFLGRGYGRAAASTRGAIALMRKLGGPALDEVYSGKSGAALFQRFFAHGDGGPYLFWATKSSAPLPSADATQLEVAPERWQRWLAEEPLP